MFSMIRSIFVDPRDPQKASSFFPWLALATGLGLLLRLKTALTAPWYWDEGYVAELAQSLVHLGRPHLGGLWQDGFFPLSTSFLAPLSIAPFAALPGLNAMQGARLWAVLFDSGAIILLGLLGHRLDGKKLGLFAAFAYALSPYACAYGGRAFYHHFSIFFLLSALWGTSLLWQAPTTSRIRFTAICTGLAVTSSYWLWWLPLSLLGAIAWKSRRSLPAALLWMSLLPLLGMVVNFAPDPAGAWWSVRGLLGSSSSIHLIRALTANLFHLPTLAAGLLGLSIVAYRKPILIPVLICLIFAILEPTRQRGDIHMLPYPFMAAMPLAILGAAALALELRRLSILLMIVPILALAYPQSGRNLTRWSFEPAPVHELKVFLSPKQGGLVCGLPHFNWSLKPEIQACEPADIAVAENYPSAFYVPDAPASRLALDCRFQNVRYFVSNRLYYMGLELSPGMDIILARITKQGWPLVFDNRVFKVYENPLFQKKSTSP